ncbi:MAG: thermonuclease family protein [Xanthobacteraceae bacterium]
MRHSLSSAALTHRRSGRPLGGLLPIIGVIFGLGLAAGAIFRPPLTPTNPQIGLHNRGAMTWSRQRYADFNPQVTYPAEVLRVIDGDTFEARVRVWRGFEVDTRVRLRAIDAPELHARCAAEYVKAEAARAALQRILSAGGVTVSQVGPDKYRGRVDAAVATRDTPDVSAALLNGGFARSYNGGRREPWC